jgi:hypothetical protein
MGTTRMHPREPCTSVVGVLAASCCAMALVGSALQQRVSAQPKLRTTTATGVSFAIPTDFREQPSRGALRNDLGTLDQLFIDSTGTVQIVVAHGRPEALRVQDLPANSGPLPQPYADGDSLRAWPATRSARKPMTSSPGCTTRRGTRSVCNVQRAAHLKRGSC